MFIALFIVLLGIGRISASPPRYLLATDPEINHVYHAIGKFICIVVLGWYRGFFFFFFSAVCAPGVGSYLSM